MTNLLKQICKIHISLWFEFIWIVIYWIMSHCIKISLFWIIITDRNFSDIIGLGTVGLFAWLVYHDIRVTQIGRRLLRKFQKQKLNSSLNK